MERQLIYKTVLLPLICKAEHPLREMHAEMVVFNIENKTCWIITKSPAVRQLYNKMALCLQ